MARRSSSADGRESGDPTLSANEVVTGYRNLIEVEPEAASGRVDRVAAVLKSSRAARVAFVDAVTDLIVALPPAGARYPAQVLADLVADDAMVVREKAAETVADLAATLGPAHLYQFESLFAATGQLLTSDDHVFVREKAGAACLTLAMVHDGVGLSTVTLLITFLEQTLSSAVFGRVLERVPTVDVRRPSTPTTG
jgi:hypothetical protein